jgi:antitoxin VapB
MSLNIKNERTHALVRELAARSGMSQTQAVEDAVKRRLEQLSVATEADAEERVDRVLALAKDISARLRPESFDDVSDWLYDENGLPR